MSLREKYMQNFKEKVFAAARDGMAITLYAILSNKSQEVINEILTAETAENGQTTTPFIIAARNGYDKVVSLLIDTFKADLGQVGKVKFDGYVIEGATALWCAAAAGHFDVVKTLVEHGADVNQPTFSNSTPLRAACFDGRLDIVHYLIKNKADLNISNKYDNTCLMIASYKGHTDVCKYLLHQKADPNVKAKCGATALHFACEHGHLSIVQLLIENGAVLQYNDQGMSPLHVAAESSQAEIVEYFVTNSKLCDKKLRVEALELLGASYANDKDHYDPTKTYNYIWVAMQERYRDPENILHKETRPPIEAYNNRTECDTFAQLEHIKSNLDAIHMEALMIRERILGEDNVELPHAIIFRGAVFADVAKFDRCIALWMRAMQLRQKNSRTITKDLLRFAQVFSQMIHVKVPPEFDLVETVFEFCLVEFLNDQKNIAITSGEIRDAHLEIYECNIISALYLLVILIITKHVKEEEFRLCKLAYRFNKLGLRVHRNGYTPLHLVIDEETQVDDFHVNDIVYFPHFTLTQLLIKCGATVNETDHNGNTPLHLIVRYSKPISDFMTLHGIIMTLLDAGAHVDMANCDQKTPLQTCATGVAEIVLRTQSKFSLKCLCAQYIRFHNIPYKGHLPTTLEDFVSMH